MLDSRAEGIQGEAQLNLTLGWTPKTKTPVPRGPWTRSGLKLQPREPGLLGWAGQGQLLQSRAVVGGTSASAWKRLHSTGPQHF